MRGWGCNHAHEAASARSVLDLMLGESFIIITNSVDMEVMVVVTMASRRCGSGVWKGYAVVHKETGCLGVLAEIQRVKTLFGRHEFDHAFVSEDSEYSVTITAVISDVIFFCESKE
jgi:hypothetical protein